jgi:putative toxin-antitoxin system antitoxin component (TIGR02293 family)
MAKSTDILEKNLTYKSVDDRNIFILMDAIKAGIKFTYFISITKQSPFSLSEWSGFLQLSERTMQRYKREKGKFDPIQSEKILEILLLYKLGIEVFGNNEKFSAWLGAKNMALGSKKPIELLDNSFGISLLKDELTRIEHGVLA